MWSDDPVNTGKELEFKLLSIFTRTTLQFHKLLDSGLKSNFDIRNLEKVSYGTNQGQNSTGLRALEILSISEQKRSPVYQHGLNTP